MPRSEFHRLVFGLVTAILGTIVSYWVGALFFPGYYQFLPFTLPGLGFTLFLFVMTFVRHRARRRLVAADFLLCPKCDYPLNDLAASGQCPECGEPFTAAQVRRAWRRYYRFPPFGDAP